MFWSRYLPCPACGESVDQTAGGGHTCDPERRADFVMFTLRDDIAAFEDNLRSFLNEPHGRFESWLAARQVRRTP